MESKKAKAAQLQEKTTAAGLSAPDEAQHHQGSSEKASYTEVDPFTGSPKGEDDTLKKGPAEAQVQQGSSEKASYTEQDPHNAASNTPDTSLKKGNSEPQHRQGDSRDAEYSEGGNKVHNGNTEAPTNPGAGEVPFKEDKDIDAEAQELAEKRQAEMKESLRKDIESVFATDETLSEEFKTQAAAIFETAVIARVNNEVEAIQAELQEQAVQEFEELKEGLIEKVDSYLSYVAEQWMKDNEVEVETGLRAEVAEDFMLGLKNLFKEHYFEVPEDKVDVLEDMSNQVDEITSRLDESIELNIALKEELDALKRAQIIGEACKDLTATDAEKMGKLLEGVEFGDEDLFKIGRAHV